jgi:TP901 family phage tail tape measure protein
MAERDFQTLLDLITKTTEQIGRLEAKMTNLEKQLTSGDLGTGKVRELNNQLTTLMRTLDRKQNLLGNLLNERDLRAADAGLDRLSRSVATVKKNLDALYTARTQSTSIPGIEDQIRRQERALALLEAQQRKRGVVPNPGTPGTGGFKPSTLEPVDERRLNAVTLGVPLTNAEIMARGRQTAKEVLNSANEAQNQLLRDAIAQRKPVSTGLQSAVDRATKADQSGLTPTDRQRLTERNARIRELNAEYDALDRRENARRGVPVQDFNRRSGGNVTVLSGGRDDDFSNLGTGKALPVSDIPDRALNIRFQEFFQALSTYARRIATIEGLSTQGGGGRRQNGEGTFDPFTERIIERQRQEAFRAGRLPTFESGLEARRASGQSLVPDSTSPTDRAKQAQERLLNTLRGRIASEEKYRQALDQATKQGFTINDLKRSQRAGTAGIEKLQFERNEGGVNRRFDTYVQPSGRATPGISNQFRSFGQGVVRDIGELTKWSIALAAVYGPLRKLQELTQIMIENQTRLAEAATSVASSFIGQDEIFNAAADAAERAGESVEGVIDAFTLAYRAAGGGTDEVERFAVATELLDNALILSKLSSLDQATAIDTLAAAMRQTSGELTGSIELLDSWVRVTKVANVDLASLATGFAVLGDSAEAAQITVDQLNGIIGAIGETGLASGRELANTARAIVSGFQSDQAREALENIGVAVEDSTGKMRPFLDIMTELSNLRLSGALDDTAFSKLTLALGGGSRRQAVYATFIENIARVNEIAAESAKANGDAQAALARQLETVQTSLTRLGNSFQELAQAMGTEGGFLGIITSVVDGMTLMVNLTGQLTSALGKATPALLAFVAASAVLRYRGQGGIQQALGGIGTGFQRDPELLRLAQYGGGNVGNVPAQGRGRQFLQSNVLGTGAISGGVQGLAVAALPALLNLANKDDPYRGSKATANVIGGVGGGIIGSLVAGSPIIGAAVGTAISEAFINATVARGTDVFGYGAPKLGEPVDVEAPSTVEDLDAALKEAEAGIYKAIGFGNEAIGKLLSDPGDRAENVVAELNQAIKDGNKEAFDEVLRQTDGFSTRNREELNAFGVSNEFLERAFKEERPIEFNEEFRARQLAEQRGEQGKLALEEFDKALAARVARGGTPLDQTTAFSREQDANTKAFLPLLKQIQDASKSQLRTDRLQGDVRGAEYGRRTEAISGYDTKALQYYTALGDEVDRIDGEANDAAKAFEVLNNVIVFGSPEALPQLTAIGGEIEHLVNLLSDPVFNEEEILKLGGLEDARLQLQTKREDLANLIEDANQQALLGRLSVPNVEGDINKPLSTGDLGVVEQRARELQDDFYQGFLQIPDDMYDALKDSWDEWAQIVEDSGNVFFKTVSEIDPQFFQQAMAQLLEENRLESQEKNPFGIQSLDIGSEREGELQGLIQYFTGYLAQNFPQYEQKPEDVGVIFNDYVTSVLHGDNLAIKLALEKLVDLNQKQLDGMYNIPEGATFWVPLTAAYYRPQNNGGEGGLPPIDSQAVDSNTSATDANTRALESATSRWLDAERYRDNRVDTRAGSDLTRGQRADALRLEAQADRYNTDRGRVADAARYTGLAGLYNNKQQESGPPAGFWETLMNWFRNLTTPISGRMDFGGSAAGGVGGGGAGGGVSGAGYRGIGTLASAAPVNPQVNARLDLQFENTTQLIVDGRILASVMSPYMAQEMVRLEASQGTITKRYVI